MEESLVNKNIYECNYCGKVYKTKGNLKTHQENAKFCLELRKKRNDIDEENLDAQNKCEYCCKILTTKHKLEKHKNICRSKSSYISFQQLYTEHQQLKVELNFEKKQKEEYLQQIKILQDKLNEIALAAIEKPRITTNNQNQSIKHIDNRTFNMIPWNLIPEEFQKTLQEKFSERHFLNGQKGVAEFMLENVLIQEEENEEKKYLMKCTDPSRKTFITLDEEGKVVKDINAENLTRLISDPVKEKCQEIYKNIHNDYLKTYENVGNELEEGDPDQQKLDYIGAKFEHATDKVVEIARLKNNNTEFVKTLIPSLSM